MDRFFSVLKKHVLMGWLAVILGNLATFAVGIGIALLGAVIALIWMGSLSMQKITAFGNSISRVDTPAELFGHLSPWIGTGIFLLLIVGIISFLFEGFLYASAYTFVTKAVRDDHSSIEDYFKGGWRRMVRMAWLMFLVNLPFIILFSAIAVPLLTTNLAGFTGTQDDTTVFIQLLQHVSIAVIIGFLGFIVLKLFLFNAPAILIAEETTAWKAITTSFRFTSRHFGKVFVTGIILLAFNAVTSILSGGYQIISMLPHTAMNQTVDISDMILGFLAGTLIETIALFIITYRYFRIKNGNSEVAVTEEE